MHFFHFQIILRAWSNLLGGRFRPACLTPLLYSICWVVNCSVNLIDLWGVDHHILLIPWWELKEPGLHDYRGPCHRLRNKTDENPKLRTLLYNWRHWLTAQMETTPPERCSVYWTQSHSLMYPRMNTTASIFTSLLKDKRLQKGVLIKHFISRSIVFERRLKGCRCDIFFHLSRSKDI